MELFRQHLRISNLSLTKTENNQLNILLTKKHKMKMNNILNPIRLFAFLLIVIFITSCNFSNKKDNSNNSVGVSTSSEKETVPDSIVQFLIASAAKDFHSHHPPTAIDFRKIEIGYLLSSKNDKTFILCGEFLSEEEKEWNKFATMKTEGYEQHLGLQALPYCQEANFVLTNNSLLAVKLKNKLTEMKEQK